MSAITKTVVMKNYFQFDFSTEIISAGVGQTGKTVNAVIRRRSDNLFFDGAGGWGASPTNIAMTEIDATNMAGLYTYRYDMTQSAALKTSNEDGFDVKISETTTTYLEYLLLQPRDVARDLLENSFETQWYTNSAPSSAAERVTLAGRLWSLINGLLHQVEIQFATPEHAIVAQGPAGSATKFYIPAGGPGTADSAQYAGSTGMIYRTSGVVGEVWPVRIVAIQNDGASYFLVSQLDGTNLPNNIAVGDILIIRSRNESGTGGDLVTDIFERSMSEFNTAGTFGDDFNRMLRLRQNNMRVINTSFNPAGQPVAGYVLTYDSASDVNTDVDPWALATGRYDFTATYDAGGNMTQYRSVKTS